MSARREQLLDLAADVLEEEGLDAFGIGTLARAAGIKPPSLYKHFTSLADIENALISRGFAAFAADLAAAAADAADTGLSPDAAFPAEATAAADAATSHPVARDRRALVAAFADVYRHRALAAPQLYRLMTARPLDRAGIEPGSEEGAMAGLLALFGESNAHHDAARAAWAWAHGLVSLEIAGRFPPGADVDAAWRVLVETLTGLTASADIPPSRHALVHP